MATVENPFPSHIGIIMDGNGRWAQNRELPRSSGHKEGLEVAKRIVAHASDRGVDVLSLYVFSTENWRRTENEVDFLFNLVKTNLRRQYAFYKERRLRIIHSGCLETLPEPIQREISMAEQDTANFDGMQINLLINYGGRDEIVRMIRRLAAQGFPMDSITENDISVNLDQSHIPEPDLIIRTGGENRLSNFLLWQSAYTELYFCDAYWPDWTSEHLDKAISWYQNRKRRFGGICS